MSLVFTLPRMIKMLLFWDTCHAMFDCVWKILKVWCRPQRLLSGNVTFCYPLATYFPRELAQFHLQALPMKHPKATPQQTSIEHPKEILLSGSSPHKSSYLDHGISWNINDRRSWIFTNFDPFWPIFTPSDTCWFRRSPPPWPPAARDRPPSGLGAPPRAAGSGRSGRPTTGRRRARPEGSGAPRPRGRTGPPPRCRRLSEPRDTIKKISQKRQVEHMEQR